jgi:hypothetical protein
MRNTRHAWETRKYGVFVGEHKGDHFEDLGVYWRITLRLILKKCYRIVWTGVIYMAQNRDCWQVVANTLINTEFLDCLNSCVY